MKISLIDFTKNAKELLIFSKNTRHLTDLADFNDVLKMLDEEKDKEIEYVFGTIGTALEFANYVFLIQDVSRGFSHQLVRTRHASFAQQSMRVAPQENFSYFIPDNIEKDNFQLAIYTSTMNTIQENYNLLLGKHADVQDARGVLPTNICTNILMGINLRAFSHLMETRLCVRAQGEYQQVAMRMRELVLEKHPWAEPILYPYCITKGVCQFSRFDKCPLKNKYNHLNPPSSNVTKSVVDDWAILMEYSYSPQPEQRK